MIYLNNKYSVFIGYKLDAHMRSLFSLYVGSSTEGSLIRSNFLGGLTRSNSLKADSSGGDSTDTSQQIL